MTTLSLLACVTAEFREAEALVRQQKFFSAIEMYLSFVRDHPRNRRAPEALYEAGSLQLTMLGESEKAQTTFRALVSNYPVGEYTLKAQQRIAEVQKHYLSNYQQAIIEYEKLLQAAPNHPLAPAHQFEIAQCYSLLHNHTQAAVEYKELVEKYPNFDRLDEVYWQMGSNAYIGGNYADAISAYQATLDRFPKSSFRVQAVFGLGTAYEEMEDFPKARDYYTQVLRDYPSPGVVEVRLRGLAAREQKKNAPHPKIAPR